MKLFVLHKWATSNELTLGSLTPTLLIWRPQGSYGALSFCLPVQAKLRLDFDAAGMPAENYSADPVTL